jgi:DNA-binding NarL/FixJ family response regulator
MRADIHDGQEHKRSIHGPDAEAQDQSSPSVYIRLATHGRSIQLGNRYPTISVVVLSAQQDRDTVMKALDLGALGFIPKSGQREVMLSAFNLIFSGGIYIPPEILNRREPATAPQAALAHAKAGASAADIGLTERQMEVLALMMQGKSNKAISRVLDLAEPTVKIHVSAILKALKAANRTEAVIAATALGVGVRQDAR